MTCAFLRTARAAPAVCVAAFFLIAVQGPSVAAQNAAQAEADDPAARSILEKADQIRFPRESFQVDIGIVSKNADGGSETRAYRVLSKGNDNTVIQITEPAAERGQTILMRGRDLWVFLPNVSQPVRLSLSQRLTGQVANGDLARANFSGDYVPRMLKSETIEDEKYHVLQLDAVDRSVTYHRVLFWVHAASNRPYKAEFYSLSGRLLKTARYQNFRNLGGKTRPTRLVMEDALKKGEVSVLEYSDMRLRPLPDKIFTKEYLKKLVE